VENPFQKDQQARDLNFLHTKNVKGQAEEKTENFKVSTVLLNIMRNKEIVKLSAFDD
jgi:hypothetical protein